MNISVTQADIRNGQRRECAACPIARAIRRKLHKLVKVGCWSASLWRDGEMTHMGELPKTAIQFIVDFDNDRLVKPFTFQMKMIKEK